MVWEFLGGAAISTLVGSGLGMRVWESGSEGSGTWSQRAEGEVRLHPPKESVGF